MRSSQLASTPNASCAKFVDRTASANAPGSSVGTTRAGSPTATMFGGTKNSSGTTAPPWTSAPTAIDPPAPIRAACSTVAPVAKYTQRPTRQPSRVAWGPTKTWSASTTGRGVPPAAVARSTACSQTIAHSPTSTREPSASRTAPYSTRARGPTRTSPTRVAVGATNADGSTVGSRPRWRSSIGRLLLSGAQAPQQEQVLARLVVVDGDQQLPVAGDDQALRLPEPVGERPDAVDLDQPVVRGQGRLQPGDATRLVAEQVDAAIRADGDVAQVPDALHRLAAEVPGGQQPEGHAALPRGRELAGVRDRQVVAEALGPRARRSELQELAGLVLL